MDKRTTEKHIKPNHFGKTQIGAGAKPRLGNYEDIIKMPSKIINNVFSNTWGIDLETKGLEATKNSIIEAALRKGFESKAFFVEQNFNFNLEKDAPFLAKSGFGDLIKKAGVNFNKPGKVSKFNEQIHAYHNTFKGRVEANVTNTAVIRQEINKFINEAIKNKKPIFIQNANFEIRQLDALYKGSGQRNPLAYSSEYLESRSELMTSNKGVFKRLKDKKINKSEALDELVSNQKKHFTLVMQEAFQGGKVVDVQDIGRMLNAVAQSKGYQLQTGAFGANTNIDHLSKIFLNQSEAHEGVLDLAQQELVAKRMLNTIQNIEQGKINDFYTDKFIKSNKANATEWYRLSMKKAMINELEQGGDIQKVKNFNYLDVDGINRNAMFDKLLPEVKASVEQKAILKSNNILSVSEDKIKRAKAGSMLFGGILLGSAAINLFKFSGRDDDYNTIEALRHGSPIQNEREKNTSFGSGYQAQKFHQAPNGQEEQEGVTWKQLGFTGLGAIGAYSIFKNQAKSMRLNDLTYLGKLDPSIDNEILLGRKESTVQDILVSGVRRLENTLGGVGKSFGVGNVISYGMYDSAEFIVDLSTKQGGSYAKYMDKLLKRKLIEEGVDAIMFKKGELFERIDGKYKKIEGNFSLIKTVINHDLSSKISDFAKSAAYQQGISRLDDLAAQPFLIVGGKGNKAVDDFVNAFLHETFSKPLKLLADPMEALRDVFPDFDEKVSPHIKKILSSKYMPDIGLDGKELVNSWPSMLKIHGGKLLTFGTLAYFGLGTLDWGAQKIAPDGTPIGDAGLIGGGAYAVRKAHELYARVSDITGLTSLRDYVEEKAPGSDGLQTTAGLTGAGALFGALFGGVNDLSKEAYSAEKYKAFIQSKQKTESFTGPLSKIFKDKYTPMGKSVRTGGVIGFLAALPFTLAGLGAESSASELAAEYSGEKQVAVKKGRFWETGFTPFEGGEIDYYRPNWYAKLMDDAKNEELYGGKVSPFYEAMKTISDPYWREKLRYHSQPYPVTGPDGSMLGIFGPIYEASIGRILKPVATMHESVLPEELINNTEYDAEALLRKQWNATLEFMGLRGFAIKAVKENLTGSQEIFADPNEARSAKDIDSIVKDFYDLQIGGGFLTTEALRRVFQNQDSFAKAQLSASINLNPLKNAMPSWMPGSDYVVDFKSGDPFLKVKDGYYRLPGAGFSSRYEELKDVDPENYADIYKYQILSDVAYGSRQFREIKGRLQNRELTEYEQNIFDEVERQVREKKESEVNVRDPSTYDSFLGRYSAFLTDLARSNPLETLLPISPAHKFLGPPDVTDYMDEQMYSKEYRSWANPIDDFIIPGISMTMNSLGLGGIDMNDDPELYQDKMQFVEYSNMARQAQMAGDLRSADRYTLLAQKTYTAKNLYTHPADVASSMPTNERKIFNYFIASDVATKQKMMQNVNPRYKDAYQAQLDMQIKKEMYTSRMNNVQRRRILRDIVSRQEAIEARRKSEAQDLLRQQAPNGNTGRSNYLNNRARDYHDYQPIKSATDSSLAQGVIPSQLSSPASYTSHYSNLNKAGIENALVVLRPGLDNSAKINIKIDRREERNGLLRDWSYIL